MFDVRANPFDGRIHISLAGKLEMKEAAVLTDKVLRSARAMPAGFAVVTDIRGLVPVSEDVRLLLQDNMRALAGLGQGPAVRIISAQAQVTANQFQRTSRAAGFTAVEVFSPAEADSYLDRAL
ncbi:MAG: hypothetical protein L0Z70_03895 [Chloroflexi bacterium]|nr:hypothetical protein [Chloroflexota bacterium]